MRVCAPVSALWRAKGHFATPAFAVSFPGSSAGRATLSGEQDRDRRGSVIIRVSHTHLAVLAREGDHGPEAAPAHPGGHAMGRGDGTPAGQPLRPDRSGSRRAELHRPANEGAGARSRKSAGVSELAWEAPRRHRVYQNAQEARDQRGAARFPVVVPGLGGRGDRPSARGGGGGFGPYGPQPSRGRLPAHGPFRSRRRLMADWADYLADGN